MANVLNPIDQVNPIAVVGGQLPAQPAPNQYVPAGQTPLSGQAPTGNDWGQGQWQGAGGGDTAAQWAAWKDFSSMFGRNPTQQELAQLAGGYSSGDPNKLNFTQGKSVVAQYYNSVSNTPQAQQNQQNATYLKDAPKYYDQINQQFQSTVGREATQEEKDHFGSLMASGSVDAYTVGQFLQQLPEAVTKQDATFRNSLRSDMTTQDARYFGEQILPGIQSNFAKQGRSVDSSGFANAAAQAGQQQNTAREGFLTNLTANQYSGNKANAYNDYLNSVGRLQAGQDYSRARTNQLADQVTGRVSDIENFAMQKQAYDQYLQRYGKRGNVGAGAIQGGASGAGAGAGFGPWGAAIGGIAGAGLGAFSQSQY